MIAQVLVSLTSLINLQGTSRLFLFLAYPESAYEAPHNEMEVFCESSVKAALVLQFGNQSDAAQALGLLESRLSRIIHYRSSAPG